MRMTTAVCVSAEGERADLVKAGRQREVAEEYVGTIQGYVIRTALPPYRNKSESVYGLPSERTRAHRSI